MIRFIKKETIIQRQIKIELHVQAKNIPKDLYSRSLVFFHKDLKNLVIFSSKFCKRYELRYLIY